MLRGAGPPPWGEIGSWATTITEVRYGFHSPALHVQQSNVRMIQQFTWSIDALNKELDSPLSPTELLRLQQQTEVADLVAEIARKKEYRRIARFLPSHLAQAAIDIIQW